MPALGWAGVTVLDNGAAVVTPPTYRDGVRVAPRTGVNTTIAVPTTTAIGTPAEISTETGMQTGDVTTPLPYCDDPKIALDTSGIHPACKEHAARKPAATPVESTPQLRTDHGMRSDKTMFNRTKSQ